MTISKDTAPPGSLIRLQCTQGKPVVLVVWEKIPGYLDFWGFRTEDAPESLQCSPWAWELAAEFQPQPAPTSSEMSEEVLPAVLARIEWRRQQGLETYGTSLKTFNGRRVLEDALDEALDLAMYIQQEILERKKLMSLLDKK